MDRRCLRERANKTVPDWSEVDLDDDFAEPSPLGWRCLGCGFWWDAMPAMEPEGMAAICKMRPRDQGDDE